ncbi:hypothetical protein V2P20_09130 [Methylobacter sp. Wu1]|uniref:hypothetical protein n=1 Tax=Methylobacter sp. Wu1 TaxID=3119359 RepID=UPI002F95D55B
MMNEISDYERDVNWLNNYAIQHRITLSDDDIEAIAEKICWLVADGINEADARLSATLSYLEMKRRKAA